MKKPLYVERQNRHNLFGLGKTYETVIKGSEIKSDYLLSLMNEMKGHQRKAA